MSGWVIILTFVLGVRVGQHSETIRCPTERCVQNLIQHAHESRALARLRVFECGAYLLPGGAPVWPPIIDYQFQ